MNRIHCVSCGKDSLAFDNFLDLSVSIPRSGLRITGNVTLEKCLDAFVKTEKME